MFEVRRVLHQGEIFTPIFDRSRMVTMEELRTLAAEPVEDAPERLAKAVLITHETPKLGQWEELPAKNFDIPEDVRVMLGDTGLPVASIEDVESVEDTDIGAHLRAVVKFLPTKLGEICYRGMCAGVLSGVCAVVLWGTHIKTGRAMGSVREVRLGCIEASCLASARIWPISTKQRKEPRTWQEEDPVER